MIRLRLTELADVVGGELASPADGARVVDDVTIDSRSARPGSLFVPLRGERADGHDYIADASRRGASGYLLEARRHLPDAPGGVVVDDPADALLGLGAWVRASVDPVVVAITGSTGKTSTKDLAAAALAARRRTVASHGSYNNDLGVPLTCCRLRADSEVLVAEVGSRGPGHIARLTPALAPDVAVVTAVGAAHLSTFGDLDTIARAKSELVAGLPADGVAVLNADDPRVVAMARQAPGRVVTYGLAAGADWRAERVALDELARPSFTAVGPAGRVDVRLPMPGAHNVGNALAALAVAELCAVDPAAAAAALTAAALSPWRMELVAGRSVTVLNDAYNANPASMRAALSTLAAMRPAAPSGARGRRLAALGLMAELGRSSQAEHAELGRLCARLGLDGLVVVGGEAAAIAEAATAAGFAGDAGVALAAGPDEALALLRERLRPGDLLLVKASRAAGLERLAAAVVEGVRE